MKTIVIGDVHGELFKLSQLVNRAALQPGDTIVFAGDLIDKGPDSGGVVRFVRNLADTYNVVVVEGNHDEKFRRFRKHLVNGDAAIANRMREAKEWLELYAELEAEDLAFMDSFVPFHRLDEYDVLVVHGGIPGDMTEFPATVEEVRAMSRRERKHVDQLMRTRYLAEGTGEFVKHGENTATDPFWAEEYDGRFGHVVFGHEPFMEGVRQFRHATGIDTGATFGGMLTGLVYEGTGLVTDVFAR